MVAKAAAASASECNMLTTSWSQIEELVDGLGQFMPKLLNGDGSEYEFAAGMLATRLFKLREHAHRALTLSASIQTRRAALLSPQKASPPTQVAPQRPAPRQPAAQPQQQPQQQTSASALGQGTKRTAAAAGLEPAASQPSQSYQTAASKKQPMRQQIAERKEMLRSGGGGSSSLSQ